MRTSFVLTSISFNVIQPLMSIDDINDQKLHNFFRERQHNVTARIFGLTSASLKVINHWSYHFRNFFSENRQFVRR